VIVASAENILGFEERSRNEWYDEECRRLVEERNKARLKLLQRHARSSANGYQNKRRLAKAECRRKKRMWERAKLEEIDELSKRKETRQLCLKTGQLKKRFQPRTSFCKNKNGDLIHDNKGVLKRWS
jgi:hypothetical protein